MESRMVLPTSISDATSRSAAMIARTIFTAPVTARISLASSRESLTSSMIGLIGSGLPPAPGGTSSARTVSRRSEEHTSELQSLTNLVCRLLLEKKKKKIKTYTFYKKKKQKQ